MNSSSMAFANMSPFDYLYIYDRGIQERGGGGAMMMMMMLRLRQCMVLGMPCLARVCM